MRYLSLWFELIALILCLVNFRHLQTRAMKGFLLLLLMNNAVEWGNFFHLFVINNSNNWTANIRNPLEFAFIGWFFKQITDNKQLHKRINLLTAVILVSSALNFFFLQGFRYLNSYTIILGSCIGVYYIFEYVRETIEKAEIPDLVHHPYFWVSVGYLFFYAGQSVLLSFFQYFLSTGNFEPFIPIWSIFITLINFILYTCLSISFFCRIKQPGILYQA